MKKVRAKTKKRLFVLMGILAAALVLGGGAYGIRKYVQNKSYASSRETGLAAARAGDSKTAVDQLGNYLAKYYDDAEAWDAYAVNRLKRPEPGMRHIGQAILAYRRLMELRPQDAAYPRKLLELYQKLDYNTEALRQAESMLSANPSDLDALNAKMIALNKMRKFSEASAVAQKLAKLSPDDYDIQRRVITVLSQDDTVKKQIIKFAADLQQKHPDQAGFMLLRSTAYLLMGQRAESTDWAMRAKAAQYPDARFCINLAEQLDMVDQFDAAQDVLAAGQKAFSDEEIDAACVANLYCRRQYQLARDLAVKNPNLPDIIAYKALAARALGDEEYAKKLIASLRANNDARGPEIAQVLELAPEENKTREIIDSAITALQRDPSMAYLYMVLGDAYLKQSEIQKSINAYRGAVVSERSWGEPLLRLSSAAANFNNTQDAVELATQALKRMPRDNNALIVLARARASGLRSATTHELQQLLTLTQDIHRDFPREDRVEPLRISLLSKIKGKDAGLAAARDAIGRQPAMSEAALMEMMRVSADLDFGIEDQCIAVSLKAHGMTPVLAFQQAGRLLTMGKNAEALRQFEESRKGAANDIKWDLAWATLLEMVRDNRAHDTWVKLSNTYPDDIRAQAGLISAPSVQADRNARAMAIERLRGAAGENNTAWKLARAQWIAEVANASEKDLAEARDLLQDVTRSEPALTQAHLLLANILTRQGNISGAVDRLTLATQVAPNSARIQLELARLLQEQKTFDKSSVALQRVMQNSQAQPSEKKLAAVLAERQGNLKLATAILEQVHDQEIDATDILLPDLYRRQGDIAKAEAGYNRLLASDNPLALQQSALFFAGIGKKDVAQRAIARLKAMTLDPGTREALLADYESRFGDSGKAIDLYNAAIKTAPGNLDAWRQLILLYVNQGNGAQAAATINAARKAAPETPAVKQLANDAALVEKWSSSAVTRPAVITMVNGTADAAPARELLTLMTAQEGKPVDDASLDRFWSLVRRNRQSLAPQIVVINAYMMSGRIAQGAAKADELTQEFPGSSELPDLAMRGWLAIGKWKEAQAASEEWRKRTGSTSVMTDIVDASVILASGNAEQAVSKLKPKMAAALKEPDQQQGLITVYAWAQVTAGRPDEAHRVLWPLAEKSESWRAVAMNLAARGLRPIDRAVVWLEDLGKMISSDGDEKLRLAEAYLNLGQTQYLQRSINLMIAVAQDSSQKELVRAAAMLGLGSLAESNGDLVTAERYYRESLKLNKELAQAQNNLAMVISNRGGNLSEAEDLASAAVKTYPRAAPYWDTLGYVRAKKKSYSMAIDSQTTALQLDPGNPEWRVNLAGIYAQAGMRDKVMTTLSDAVQITGAVSQWPKPLQARYEELRQQAGVKQ